MIGPADQPKEPIKAGAGEDHVLKFIYASGPLISSIFGAKDVASQTEAVLQLIRSAFMKGSELGLRLALEMQGDPKEHPAIKAALAKMKPDTKELELVSCLAYCVAQWAATMGGGMGRMCKETIIPLLEETAKRYGFDLPDPRDPMSFFKERGGGGAPWEMN